MDITTEGSTLVLWGDFDVRSTAAVRDALYRHLACHPFVIVDLSQVVAIDLPALRVLALASRRAIGEGHHVTLRGCGPEVRRMMHRSRLRPLLDVA